MFAWQWKDLSGLFTNKMKFYKSSDEMKTEKSTKLAFQSVFEN